MKQYFGKHAGSVTANDDPLQQGRIRVKVESVTGTEDSAWAMPAAPYAGPGVGLWAIPPLGAKVWVEYEEGDPHRPIWTGCYWAEGEVPLAATPGMVVLKTGSCTLLLDDRDGERGVTIETAGMKIVLGEHGVEITNGTARIQLVGPTVKVNDDALEVT